MDGYVTLPNSLPIGTLTIPQTASMATQSPGPWPPRFLPMFKPIHSFVVITVLFLDVSSGLIPYKYPAVRHRHRESERSLEVCSWEL